MNGLRCNRWCTVTTRMLQSYWWPSLCWTTPSKYALAYILFNISTPSCLPYQSVSKNVVRVVTLVSPFTAVYHILARPSASLPLFVARHFPSVCVYSVLTSPPLSCCMHQVYFEDSLKFFLSLYGHKLPVLCMSISSDNTLLITGSADKNVKIWGLDFGDCHR